MESISKYLQRRSKEICKDNHCTEDEHNCASYAYIQENGELMDICQSEYFQRCSRPYAAIPLPWTGTQKELEAEVADQCFDESEA